MIFRRCLILTKRWLPSRLGLSCLDLVIAFGIAFYLLFDNEVTIRKQAGKSLPACLGNIVDGHLFESTNYLMLYIFLPSTYVDASRK